MIGIPVGYTAEGKPNYVLKNMKHEGINDFEEFKNRYLKNSKQGQSPILIPCGKCAECRLSYSRDWANRCMLELKEHEESYFVTLTYDDDHLVNKNGEKIKEGEYPSLFKKHVQKFLKDLRYRCGNDKIRFFVAGEYGTESLRPHYHIIIFGLHIPDLKFYKRSSLGDIYWTSDWLESIWKRGYCVIGEVQWESAAYTARYCMKKANGECYKDLYEHFDINPEFTNMSRRPGIGRNYFDTLSPKDLYRTGISISTNKGGKEINIPKYYKRLWRDLYPEFMDEYREDMSVSCDDTTKEILSGTTLGYIQYLDMLEEISNKKAKTLRRKEI